MEEKDDEDGIEKLTREFIPGTSVVFRAEPGKFRDGVGVKVIKDILSRGGTVLVIQSKMSTEKYFDLLEQNDIDVQKAVDEHRLLVIDWYSFESERIIGIKEEDGVIRSSRDILNLSISVNKALKKLDRGGEKVAVIDCFDKAMNLFGWDTVYEYFRKIIEKMKKYEFTPVYYIEEELDEDKISSMYSISEALIKIEKVEEERYLKFLSLGMDYDDLEPLTIYLDDHGRIGLSVPSSEVKFERESKISSRVEKTSDKKRKVNGKVNGRVNGRVNGKTNGRVNGRVNGKTNGRVNGRVNGKTNGRVNGRVNGKTNGRVNGRVNGKTNGRVNGRVNGKTNGRVNGRVNGKTNGRVNGRVNGKTNGRVNGQINGMVNGEKAIPTGRDLPNATSLAADDGLVNGISGISGPSTQIDAYREEEMSLAADDGLVNGMGGVPVRPYHEDEIQDTFDTYSIEYDEERMRKRRDITSLFKKGLGTVLIMFFLLFIPVLLNMLYVPVEEGISIDGEFGDWEGVRVYMDPSEDDLLDGSIDIREYRLLIESGYLYVYIETEDELFETNSVDSIRCFIDISEGQGYGLEHISSDYLLEIYGWDGDPMGTHFFEFDDSRPQDDWNGFKRRGGATVEYEENRLETRLWIGELQYTEDPKIIVHTQSGDHWDMSEGSVLPGDDSIVLDVRNVGPRIVDTGTVTPYLQFDVFSLSGDSLLENITVQYNDLSAAAVESVTIYEGDVDSVGDNDRLITSIEDFDGDVNIPIQRVINETMNTFTMACTVSSSASPQTPVGLKITDAFPESGLASIKRTNLENYYVDNAPSSPRVDGAFADWNEQPTLSDDFDDLAPFGQWNPNIDIRRYGVADGAETHFMVSVEGNMMGGADVPFLRGRPTEMEDSDRDGIPDIDDPYPSDFDNDGQNDSMELVNGYRDVDSDGVPEHPHGDDMWINTTIPDTPDFPEQYRNETVSRYVGPVELPVRTGEDYVRIFIDADEDITTGYRAPWLTMGVDYMINITGRNMEITSAHYNEYRGSGTSWEWDRLGDVDVALNHTSLETALDLDSLGIDDNYTVSFASSDWENNLDTIGNVYDNTRTRSFSTKLTDLFEEIEMANSIEGIDPYSGTEKVKYDMEETNDNDLMRAVEEREILQSNENKELHLTDADSMATTHDDASDSLRIQNDDSNTWTQDIPFAQDFNITGSSTVSLYLEPTSATGFLNGGPPDVTVTAGYDGVELDDRTMMELTEDGWYDFNLDMSGSTVPAGDSLWIDVEVTNAGGGFFGQDGYVDVYFGSDTYDSLLQMETDTYIDVVSVKSYNSTDETTYFNPGETVNVVSTIEDPFGSYDISGATIDIISPNGTYLVQNGTMTESTSTSDSLNFTYSYTLSDDAPEGEYTMVVTGTESNGVTDTESKGFYVPPQHGVSIYPDQFDSGNQGETVSYDVTVENIGLQPDTYEITTSGSSEGWKTTLMDGGNTVAIDNDGDGNWDWVDSSYDSNGDGDPDVSLDPQETKGFTIEKTIPKTADSGSDSTVMNAVSTSDVTVSDSVTLTTRTPAISTSKSLYLQSGDTLYTMEGSSTQTTTISNGGSNIWTQDPAFAKSFNITSDANIRLYIDPTSATGWFNGGWPDVTCMLSSDSTDIGDYTISSISSEGWYEFPIDASGTTIPAGESLSIDVSVDSTWGGWRGDPGYIDLYYGSTQYDSGVDMGTDSYVNVDSISTYNSTSQTDTFSAGETVTVRSKISDPFGSYDISGAEMTIYDPEGNVLVQNQSMSLYSADPNSPSVWNIYEGSYTLTSDALAGQYTVEVKGVESDGMTDFGQTTFSIPAGVEIEPDNNSTATAGTTVSYSHNITNTGKGADAFNIKVDSSQGWNVSVYDGGTLIGTDTNGDGTWDYVNPSYDSNNDGVPDTGLMTPGETMDLTVAIEVPGNAENGTVDTTTITTTSILDNSVSDSATDTTYIPEFSNILLPVGFVFLFFIGGAVYRKYKSTHDGRKDDLHDQKSNEKERKEEKGKIPQKEEKI